MNDIIELKSPTNTVSLDECNDTVYSGSQLNESIDNVSAFEESANSDHPRNCPPDHLKDDLDIVFVGINSQLVNGDSSHHYSGPGNHLWTCLYLSGLIPFEATCNDDGKLLEYGIGFTNICTRPLKGAQELTRGEMRQGSAILIEKLKKHKPKIAAFNGKGIYEAYLGNKNFYMGKQPGKLEGTDTVIFVMPSSSARCAQLPRTEDKLPFFGGLKKLRDFLRGDLTELADSEIIFTDYTEFRVTTPDPKSVRKAERRRKRKSLAALMVDSEGLVPSEAEIRNLVENKILDAYEDPKTLADAVLQKKANEVTSSPLLLRLNTVMNSNLSPEAIIRKSQEVHAPSPSKQQKPESKVKTSTQNTTVQFNPYIQYQNAPAIQFNTVTPNMSLGYPLNANQQQPNLFGISNGQIMTTPQAFNDQSQTGLIQLPNGQKMLQTNPTQKPNPQQPVYFTQQNLNNGQIQFLPIFQNPQQTTTIQAPQQINNVQGNFRFLVPQSPLAQRGIEVKPIFVNQKALEINNSLVKASLNQKDQSPILIQQLNNSNNNNSSSNSSTTNTLVPNTTNKANNIRSSHEQQVQRMIQNNILDSKEFINFDEPSFHLADRFTRGDEKLVFAAL